MSPIQVMLMSGPSKIRSFPLSLNLRTVPLGTWMNMSCRVMLRYVPSKVYVPSSVAMPSKKFSVSTNLLFAFISNVGL